jgi:hypothetical protein
VVLHGLTQNAALNGRTGRATAWDEARNNNT